MIGERLNQLRKARKMTQKDVAKELLVSTNTISLYERNRTTPPDDIKIQLAKMFNVSVDYLIGNEGVKQTPAPSSFQMMMFSHLPLEAEIELESFMDYFKTKYKL